MRHHNGSKRSEWTPNTRRLFALVAGDGYEQSLRQQVPKTLRCSGDPLNGTPAHDAPVSAFGSNRSRAYGLSQLCRQCHCAYVKTRRRQRREQAHRALDSVLADIRQREHQQ